MTKLTDITSPVELNESQRLVMQNALREYATRTELSASKMIHKDEQRIVENLRATVALCRELDERIGQAAWVKLGPVETE